MGRNQSWRFELMSGRAALLVAGALVFGPAAMASEAGEVHSGERVHVGDGDAWVEVQASQGKPAAVAVILTEGVLQGLPAARPDKPEWEFVLPMPKDGPQTGYDHVGLNWNPAGHPPKDVYTVPHFDVHYYLVGQDELKKVVFKGAGEDAVKPPPAEIVAPGYVVPPETAVEHMGLHGVNPAAPEFHGQPFTHTFIYGYYKGKLTFLEPMVTTAYLATNPDVTVQVPKPKAYSLPGYYPSQFRIHHDAAQKQYVIALEGLTPWQMDQAASR